MSTPIETAVSPITLEDIRHKALRIRDDVADEARTQVSERGTQIVLAGILGVVVVLSLAYYVGTRAGRAAASTL